MKFMLPHHQEANDMIKNFTNTILATYEDDWNYIVRGEGRPGFLQFLEDHPWINDYRVLDAFICYLVEYFPSATWLNWPCDYEYLREYFTKMGVSTYMF